MSNPRDQGEYPTLPHAPITEALIDVRVQSREGVTADSFVTLPESVRNQFSAGQRIETLEARLGFDDGGRPLAAVQQQQHLGFMFRNAERADAVQFRTDGFTYNKLFPYTNWNDIYPRAMALWGAYVQLARPVQVVRLAVRYINKIKLKLPISDIADFLKTPPTLPPTLPQQIRHFLTRVVLYDSELELSAVVTQALETPIAQDHIIVLFDTDAFRDMSLPVDAPAIADTFQALRGLKNRIFFESLTLGTLELFK